MASPEQISTSQLRALEVFRDLEDNVLDWLLEVGEIRQLKPQQLWSGQEGGATERYAFLLRGIVAIAVSPSSLSLPVLGAKTSKRPPKAQKFLGYFETGSCFSNAFAQDARLMGTARVECVAINAVTLLEIEHESLAGLLDSRPDWRQQVAETVAGARRFFLEHQDPTRRQVQDFFLRENYVTSSIVRVGRIDLCIDCNKCYDACAARHGTVRMARLGAPTLGRLTFPVVCRSCEDHPCIPVCKFKAIAYSDERGEVEITDGCIGCGLCAKSCPNDAITMAPQKNADPGGKGPKKRAVKCDHCAGFEDRACIAACPTGALVELAPNDLFKAAFAAPNSIVPSFSGESFLKGVDAPVARQRIYDRLKNWTMVVTMVLLAWLGVESFFIRTQPERSFLNFVVQATGSNFPVEYSSGRGIGHWFGYIGTTLMIASCLYTLRRRFSSFERWGSKTGWLSAHLWMGFVGATLVTYHAAFKLDRWASIACYLMWLVIVTGAVGRYVYGRVHSAVNSAEFELNALRGRCAYYAEHSRAQRAVAVLIGPDLAKRLRTWTVMVLFWEELRDRVALLWLWAFGTGHLNTRSERREMLRCFSDWAELRRRLSYCESAKPILSYWNIVHIVLAIAMFLLAGFHVVYGFIYKAV